MLPPFVPLAELSRVPAARLRIVDLGHSPDGTAPRDAYAAGHVPGAAFLDLDRWLAAPPSTERGRHPLPDPEVFAEGLSRAGLGPDVVVVALDRVGGVFAARLVWMLRAVGGDAALLDGGLRAWTDAHGEASLEVGAAPADGAGRPAGTGGAPRVDVPARPFPAHLVADVAEVDAIAAAALRGEDPGTVLLDAREGARFHGAEHPLDAVAGHVPGARSLPCRESVDERGSLLDDAVLRERLRAVGVDVEADEAAGSEVVSSCGSGVTACHTLLVLEHLGLGRGRLFPGSWSQWTGTGRPVATA